MKGLIRNNFYTVEGSLKLTFLFCFVVVIVYALVARLSADGSGLLTVIIASILGGFGAVSATAMQKDAASKWNKFELTMPVSRNDVITARYLSCLLYVLMGVAMALLSVLVFYLVNGTVNLERMSYGFVFGWGFALSIPTFAIPLVLILGSDKTETIIAVSFVTGLGLFFGSSAIMSPLLENIANADLAFRAGYVVFSIVLFVLSYLLSCWIYKKKEL